MIRAIWLPSTFAFLFSVLTLLLSQTGTFLWIFPTVGYFILLADIGGRRNDYLFLSSQSDKRAIRHFNLFMRSACGRQVLIARFGSRAREMLWTEGYRWYHILPDETFTRNSPFLSSQFWKGLSQGYSREREQSNTRKM